MIGFLSWRFAPQRAAPILAGGLHPLLQVTAVAIVLLAIARTVAEAERIVNPTAAIGAVVAVVAAGILLVIGTDPVRPPASPLAFALVLLTALAADVLSAAGMWGSSNVVWDDWGPMVVGVVIVAFSMFRPGRELALATVLALVVVGGASALEAGSMPALVWPVTTAMISGTPVVLLGVLASVFSYRMSLALAREAEAVTRAEHGTRRRVRIRLRELMRDSGRVELSAEVVPFFESVLERGGTTADDALRARRLSAVLRSEILASAALPWLRRLARANPGRLVVHDQADAAEVLSVEQKVAVRALLTALLAHPDAGPVVHVRVTRVGDLRSVFVRTPWAAGEPSARRAFGSFIAVMSSAFGRSQLTTGGHDERDELRLLFAQNPRVTDAGPWSDAG
jgi:hypothetical protein